MLPGFMRTDVLGCPELRGGDREGPLWWQRESMFLFSTSGRLLLWSVLPMVLLLAAGCRSDSHRESDLHPSLQAHVRINASKTSPREFRGLTTSVHLWDYEPLPKTRTDSEKAYMRDAVSILERRLMVLDQPWATNVLHGGEARLQFHFNSNGSISDVRILTNGIHAGSGEVRWTSLLIKTNLAPWPWDFQRDQEVGYLTFRARIRLTFKTNFFANPPVLGKPFITNANTSSESEAELKKSFQSDPSYFQIGTDKVRTGDWVGALGAFAKAIDWDPEDARAFVGRGLCKAKLGDYSGALADSCQALKVDPQNLRALEMRAAAKAELHDYEGALVDCNHYIELACAPSSLAAGYRIRALIEKWYCNFDEALKDANRSVLLSSGEPVVSASREQIRFGASPARALALATRGGICRCLEDEKGAEEDCEQALMLDSHSAVAWSLWGQMQLDRGDSSAALKSFRKAMDLAPQSRYGRFQIWIIRSKAGEMLQATEELNKDWPLSAPFSGRNWSNIIRSFLAGRLTEADFLQAVEKDDGYGEPDRNSRLCEAAYYAGIKRLINGDKAGAASLFLRSLATGKKDFEEYRQARTELSLLQKQ
jgi:tetratricopeptide (TPR) repeat protein